MNIQDFFLFIHDINNKGLLAIMRFQSRPQRGNLDNALPLPHPLVPHLRAGKNGSQSISILWASPATASLKRVLKASQIVARPGSVFNIVVKLQFCPKSAITADQL